jgi:hypothetical protein
MKSVLFALLLVAFTSPAYAGFIELSATGNYRRTNIADDVKDENFSATGSFAYLFDAQSALELSYTKGEQRSEVGASSGNSQIILVNYAMAGLDFIYTLGDENSTLRPYIKMGGMYIIEKQRQTYYVFSPGQRVYSTEEPALVPSAGLGARLKISQHLSLKFGVDAWTSKSVSKENVKVDHSSRVGLSWMF